LRQDIDPRLSLCVSLSLSLSLSLSCHPRKALSKVSQRERRHCAPIDSPRYTTYQITQNSITRQRGDRCRVPSYRPKGRHHFEVERDLLLQRFYLVLQLCTPTLGSFLQHFDAFCTSTSCMISTLIIDSSRN